MVASATVPLITLGGTDFVDLSDARDKSQERVEETVLVPAELKWKKLRLTKGTSHWSSRQIRRHMRKFADRPYPIYSIVIIHTSG